MRIDGEFNWPSQQWGLIVTGAGRRSRRVSSRRGACGGRLFSRFSTSRTSSTRWLVWSAIAVFVSALRGCSSAAEVNVYGWKAESSDAKTLTFVVVTAVDDKLLTGEVLSESETDVVVAARVSRAGGSQPAVGVLRQVDV